MHLPKRDVVATGLVSAAGLFYALWALGFAPPGMSSARATGVVVLALGFAASASAVVPNFDQLIHGNKAYVAATSLIGVVALVAGVQMLLAASGTGLAVVMGAMGVLWLITTIHHSVLARDAGPSPRGRMARVSRHRPRAAGVS